MSVLKKILLFLCVFLLATVATIISYRAYQTNQIPPAKKNLPPSSKFSLANAPSDSIRGTITSFTGMVTWQSRTATQASQLTTTVPPIEQGETLNTKEKGRTTVNFPQIGTLAISPKTTINFIQTLPLNFVVEQDNGMTTYTKDGTVPISIRSLHLLINQNEGTLTVSVNTNLNRIIIDVNEGSITVAYNDLDYTSHVLTLESGSEYIFDDDTRTAITESL